MEQFKALNPLNLHWIQCVEVTAVLAPGRPALEDELIVSLRWSKIAEETLVIGLVVSEIALKRPRPVIWGFWPIEYAKFVSSSQSDELVLHKADCINWYPYWLPKTSITLFPTFDWYEKTFDSSDGEVDLATLHATFLDRLQLYQRLADKNNRANQFDCNLLDSSDVKRDRLSFFVILAALSTMDMHALGRSAIWQTFFELESRLVGKRAFSCQPSMLSIDWTEVGKLSTTELLDLFPSAGARLSKWQPHIRTWYHASFEIAAQVLRHRGALMILGRAYFNAHELKYIGMQRARSTLYRLMQTAQDPSSIGVIRDVRILRVAREVIRCMRSLSELCSSGRIFTPLTRETELTSLSSTSPDCIKHLLRQCSTTASSRDDHIKHNGRLLLAQFLQFHGWQPQSIVNLWQPKIQIAYTNPEPALKEATRDIAYIKKKRMVHPFSCTWIIDNQLCPLFPKSKDAQSAIETCRRSMNIRINPNNNNIKPSPVAFTR